MDNLLSIDAVLEQLEQRGATISAKTLYKHLREKRLLGQRVGKNWRISQQALDAFLGGRETNPPHINDPVPTRHQFTSNSFQALEEGVTWLADAARRAAATGIEDILEPRGGPNPLTIQEISNALRSARKVDLIGISLREFFGDKGYYQIFHKKLHENQPYEIRALLLDPTSRAAKARTIREDGSVYDDPEGKGKFKFYNSPLWSDIRRSISTIHAMRQMTSDKHGDKAKFLLNAKFTDIFPSTYLILTEELAFVEMYHLGRRDDAEEGSCIGATSPILKINNSESGFYHLLRSHFEYLWKGKNSFIEMLSLEKIEGKLIGEERAAGLSLPPHRAEGVTAREAYSLQSS